MSEFVSMVSTSPVSRDAIAPPQTAQERVEKLLHELRLEIQLGTINGQLDPKLSYRFYVASTEGPDKILFCEFATRLVERYSVPPEDKKFPRLREGVREG